MLKRLILLAFIVVVAGAAYLALRPVGVETADDAASLIPLLAEQDVEGFARALEPGAIELPRDLGPHPAYRTEWWYYTGNLETEAGRRFGFQFTIFRNALVPPVVLEASESEWRANQLYLAHFTISDIAADTFYEAERFSRGALGLAGARADPYRVWLEEWSVEAAGPEQVRLQAATDEVALNLMLTQTLPPILHGDAGLSQKGPEPGNASYYYSIVQQQAEGKVIVGDEVYEVTGLAWKDHEYSTSALAEGAIGWDWFSLQLDNGAALMFFQIRHEDGSLSPYSSGTFIRPDGTTISIAREEWRLEVSDSWTSPSSGATYPAGWRLAIPSIDLILEGEPLMADQELNVSTTYWEGASAFRGTLDGAPVTALGYVEMTGYVE